MPEPALDRFRRFLELLPLAAREGGMAYDDLAGTLGVSRTELDRDLAELADRDYYHTADTGSDIQIVLEAERVHVWTAGHLARPPRLAPGEAAALDLGLRVLASERGDAELADRMRPLLERLAWSVPSDVAERVSAHGDPGASDPVRALFVDAARRRRRVQFRYLKPEDRAPGTRSVEPYTVAYSGGRWYVVGHCPERDGVRIFRTDRVLEAVVEDAAFDPPSHFDVADYVDGGAVYRADQALEVVVRYGGHVAPWVLERGQGERQADGAVIVRHQVADPGWVVRHVLQYGRHAHVLEPEWVAALVRDAVAKVVGGGGIDSATDPPESAPH
jgi:predicted DNA-binding transcriptional regulator YafY